MDKKLKVLNILGILSFVVTLIMGMTESSIVLMFMKNTAPLMMTFVGVHYASLLIAVILYILIVWEIGSITHQRILGKFIFGLIWILLGIVFLAVDFGVADGLSTSGSPGVFDYIIIFLLLGLGFFLIGIGVYMVCKTYYKIADISGSIYYKLSWRLIILGIVLFFIFLLTWMVVDKIPDNDRHYIGFLVLGYNLCYAIGQLLFSIGAIKFEPDTRKKDNYFVTG